MWARPFYRKKHSSLPSAFEYIVLLVGLICIALCLCCGLAYADKGQKIDFSKIPRPRHIGPPDGTYQEYMASRPKAKFTVSPVVVPHVQSPLTSGGTRRLLVIVNSSLHADIATNLNRYVSDVQSKGYQVELYDSSGGGTAEELKAFIKGKFDEGDLVGCTFFGSLPCAWYEVERDFEWDGYYAQWPCDLFFCDMDGEWSDTNPFDTAQTGVYDGHVAGDGDEGPEIFIGRIDASMMTGASQASQTNAYLDKLHTFYTGSMPRTHRGLSYTEEDWVLDSDVRHSISYAYPNYDDIYASATTNRADYVNNRLASTTYEFIQLTCHSAWLGHCFNGCEWLLSNEIRAIPPKALFYTLNCCSASRFTQTDCVGNSYIFNSSPASLATFGSTKTMAVVGLYAFYRPLGESKPIGEAFKEWYDTFAPYDQWAVYCMFGAVILGDPLVVPSTGPVCVKPNGSDSNDGYSWETAKQTIGAALSVPNTKGQVWVAAGTYNERITITHPIALYGGFAGTETSLTERNIAGNLTIIDGCDLGDVITVSSVPDPYTRVDGFTIRNTPSGSGGGIVCDSSALTIENNTITGNTQYLGGGIAGTSSVLTVKNNSITGNQSDYGGGIYCDTCTGMITGNAISGNTSQAEAGGIYCWSSAMSISSNTFAGNNGGLGGGIFCFGSPAPTITNCMFTANTTTGYGGAILCWTSSPTITNCILKNNQSGLGGGICCCDGASPTIVCNTLVGNQATNTGGGIYCGGATPVLKNNIVCFNSQGIVAVGCTPLVSYNDAYGNTYGNYVGVTPGPGGKLVNPMFVSYPGDLHLQGSSLCIDAGTNAGAPVTDIEGQKRPRDGDGNGPAVCDMGAYEFFLGRTVSRAGVALADVDGDGLDEVVFGSPDAKLHVKNADGSELPGWPVTLNAPLTRAPAVADINGDGSLEIAAAGGRALYVFGTNGASLPGWPVLAPYFYTFTSGPALADINGDNHCEIAACTDENKLYVYSCNGGVLPGWPKDVMATVDTPAIGDVDGDDAPEIVVGDWAGYLWAWEGDGTPVSTWPADPNNYATYANSPVLADLNDDGKKEIIACPCDGKIHVYDDSMLELPGWPVTPPSSVMYASPALGDLDGDGILDIVVVSTSGIVYAYTASGTPTPGWTEPNMASGGGPTAQSSPLLADINGDGAPEVVVGCADEKLFAFANNGSVLPGWPMAADSAVLSTAAIGNMDNDNTWDIVLGHDSGGIYRFEVAGDTSKRSRLTLPWPTFHGDNGRTGTFPTAFRTSTTIYDMEATVGATVTLSACLRREPDTAPVVGKTLVFSVDGVQVGTAQTDDSGWASVPYTIAYSLNPGSKVIRAAFAGDWPYYPSAGTATLNVLTPVYIKWDSPGPTFDGTSWATAYHGVQQGLDDATAGREVWVAGATAAQRGADPNAALYVENLTMKDGVKLLGGFEGVVDHRNPGEWSSVLHGNRQGPVVTISGCHSPDTTLDGLTIQNGGDSGQYGGGIRAFDSSPTISNNVIVDNIASSGAGIYCGSSTAVIHGNTISSNIANKGAGICCAESDAAITDNTICDNSASYGSDCEGGGIFCWGGTVTIAGNHLRGNDAWWGGGVACSNSAVGSVTNNEMVLNYGFRFAAGLYISNSSVSVVNNTIIDNRVEAWPGLDPDGGGIYISQASPVTKNNIVAFNSSGIWKSTGSTPTLSNNDVYGNTLYNYRGLTAGTGDICANPQIADYESFDCRLLGSSACVDAGTDTGAPATDNDGIARPVDGNCDGTAVCDIGAYEYQPGLGVMRKGLANGAAVSVHDCGVVGIFPQTGPDWVYVEDVSRAWGIRVLMDADVAMGDKVALSGVLRADSDTGERYVEASPGTLQVTGTANVQPIGIGNKWLGGQGEGYLAGMKDGVGFYNVGMLVQAWGRVTSENTQGYFYIDDATGLQDGSGFSGVRVVLPQGVEPPLIGDYVKVVGISSTVRLDGDVVRAVRPRSAEDIEGLTTWTNGPIPVNTGAWNAVALPGIPDCAAPGCVFGGDPPPLSLGTVTKYDPLNQCWLYTNPCLPDTFGNCFVNEGYLLWMHWDCSPYYDCIRAPITGDQIWSLPVGSTPVANFTFVGNSFEASIPWLNCLVTDGVSVTTLRNAVSAGWIHKVSCWNNGDWSDVTDFIDGYMEAWTGYLVYTRYNNLAIIVHPVQ